KKWLSAGCRRSQAKKNTERSNKRVTRSVRPRLEQMEHRFCPSTSPIVQAGISVPPPPVVQAAVDQSAEEGAAHLFHLGSFTDSGVGPWQVDVNWGDGTPDTTFSASAAGSLGTQSHTYAEEGPESATVTVLDTANGLSDSQTFQVTVSDPEVLA